MSKLETRIDRLEERVNPPDEVQCTIAIVNEEKSTVTLSGGTEIPLDEYERQCEAKGARVITIGGKRWRVGKELRGLDRDLL